MDGFLQMITVSATENRQVDNQTVTSVRNVIEKDRRASVSFNSETLGLRASVQRIETGTLGMYKISDRDFQKVVQNKRVYFKKL